jgi:hypothetical protein
MTEALIYKLIVCKKKKKKKERKVSLDILSAFSELGIALLADLLA